MLSFVFVPTTIFSLNTRAIFDSNAGYILLFAIDVVDEDGESNEKDCDLSLFLLFSLLFFRERDIWCTLSADFLKGKLKVVEELVHR
jgi:hypothetical protein